MLDSQTSDLNLSGFRHEALFYAGVDDFLEQASAFAHDAMASDEPILIAAKRDRIEALQARLPASEAVQYANMEEIGSNPMRIIPAWRDFVDTYAVNGTSVRGIGEPIWAERGADELIECQVHEALLNLAFDASTPLWLVCPYDTDALPADVLDEAVRSHPVVATSGTRSVSNAYLGADHIGTWSLSRPLSNPESRAERMDFVEPDLRRVREFVAVRASSMGVEPARLDDLILAVNEVATNSLRHGAGAGTIWVWRDADHIVIEVQDRGRVDDPLIGRRRPQTVKGHGVGMWLVNHVSALVQVRSTDTGSTVRFRFGIK